MQEKDISVLEMEILVPEEGGSFNTGQLHQEPGGFGVFLAIKSYF